MSDDANTAPPRVELARHAVAQSLPPGCADDFQRLRKSLIYGPEFQWLLVDAPDEGLRRQVLAALERVLRAAKLTSSSLPLSDKIDDVAELERRLGEHARRQQVVHLIGRPGWFTAQRWDTLNVRRERIAAEVRAKLVFWLDADAIELASRGAPDVWAWRSGVYAFLPTLRPPRRDHRHRRSTRRHGHHRPQRPGRTPRPRRRDSCLARQRASDGFADEQLMAYELMRDERGVAMTRHNIAALLAATGRVEEALALLRELLSAPQQLDRPTLEAVQRQIQALLTTRVPTRSSMPPSTTA